MEDRSKHIDDLFREGLSDYKELPSTDVWQSLEQRLPAVKQPSKRWMWWIVLAALLATLSYFIINKAAEKKTNENNTHQELNTASVNQVSPSKTNEAISTNETAQNIDRKNLENKKEKRKEKNQSIQNNSTDSKNSVLKQSDKTNNNDAKVAVNSKTSLTNNNEAQNVKETKENKTIKNKQKEESSYNAVNKINRNINQSVSNNKISTQREKSTTNQTAKNKKNNNLQTKKSTVSKQAISNNSIANNNNDVKEHEKKNTKPTANNTNQVSSNKKEKTINNAQALSKNKATNKEKTRKQQVEKNNKVAKNITTPNSSKQEINKQPKEKIQANNAAGKPFNVNPDESSHKDLNIVSSGSGKNALDITPAKDGKKKEFDVKPATSNKNSNLVINGVSWKKKNIDPLAPAKEPEKKTFEVTSNGVKIMTDDEDKLTDEEQKTATINEPPATETKETEKPQEVLLATGSKPSPVSQAATNGGGGSKEPNVPLRNFNNTLKLEGGIKAGYERGTNSFTNSTIIVAPFLQWNISKSFAIMLQPGFRYNQLNKTDIFDITKSYHQINTATLDTVNHYAFDSTGIISSIQRNYIYKNFYDSIIVKNALKTKNYWEIEIPIMLRFNAATNLAVFGGLSLTLGNLIQIQENRTTISGLQRYDSLSFAAVSPNSPPPQVASANNYFNYNTADISTAPPPSNNQNPTTNPPRFGLMLGFSYELSNKIMFDVMVKQNISNMNYIPNPDVRKIYTQPNFRIMVGYKLFKSDKDKAVKNPGGL